ncbi:hypothetical protein MNB_SM-7-674 [hydrothermal vent metagenome]|uniref:Cytochrome c domain-containing protein n=1 Tax=hydrothermal vent metagenome TaxID=652676 RepID=A0A1W1C7E6_9ZZZZ
MKKMIFTAILLSGVLFAQSADEIMKANGCFACHAIASKKAAPAFAGIGKRNKRFEGANAKATIMNSIKNGSKGKYPMFADSAMPAFANLSQEELSTLADYILAQSSKANYNGGRGHGMGQGMGMKRGMR